MDTTDMQAGGQGKIPVWDIFVRCLHWALVVTVVVAWVTRHGYGRPHEWWGYAVMVIAGLRIAWGFGPSRYARFGQFLRSPRTTLTYAANVLRGRQARYLGHNPLGGWMSLALLIMVMAVCISGWLYTTDRFWGLEWVETLHQTLTNGLIALVALHLLGVIWTSIHDHENLPAAMLHGRKRPPVDGDVD